MTSDSIASPSLVENDIATSATPMPPVVSALGPRHRLKGDIESEEDFRVDGNHDGSIRAPRHAITIGPSGKVAGSAHADFVDVAGIVEGDVSGQKIVLRRTANVMGSIVSTRLTIEDGASFQGLIDTTGASGK